MDFSLAQGKCSVGTMSIILCSGCGMARGDSGLFPGAKEVQRGDHVYNFMFWVCCD